MITSAVGKAALKAREKAALEKWRGELARLEEQLEMLQELLGVARRAEEARQAAAEKKAKQAKEQAAAEANMSEAGACELVELVMKMNARLVNKSDTVDESGLTCTSSSCSSWRRVTSMSDASEHSLIFRANARPHLQNLGFALFEGGSEQGVSWQLVQATTFATRGREVAVIGLDIESIPRGVAQGRTRQAAQAVAREKAESTAGLNARWRRAPREEGETTWNSSCLILEKLRD